MRIIPHAAHHALPRARHFDPAELMPAFQKGPVESLGRREIFGLVARQDGMGDDFVYVFTPADEFRVLLFLCTARA